MNMSKSKKFNHMLPQSSLIMKPEKSVVSCFKSREQDEDEDFFDRFVFDDDHVVYKMVSRLVYVLYGASALIYGFMSTFRYNNDE